VSRQNNYPAKGASVVNSLEAAMALFPADQVVWLIGGAQLYAQGLPLASQVVVTEIDADFAGDAYAPVLNNDWQEVQRSSHLSAQGLNYSLVTWVRH
jgi:dihydrofolate reductase